MGSIECSAAFWRAQSGPVQPLSKEIDVMPRAARMDSRRPHSLESSTGLSEAETYLEHRAALDATLFRRPSSPTVTFELDSGALSLVSDGAEGDPPRD